MVVTSACLRHSSSFSDVMMYGTENSGIHAGRMYILLSGFVRVLCLNHVSWDYILGLGIVRCWTECYRLSLGCSSLRDLCS